MQLLYNIAAIIIVVLIIPMFMIRAVRERGFVLRHIGGGFLTYRPVSNH